MTTQTRKETWFKGVSGLEIIMHWENCQITLALTRFSNFKEKNKKIISTSGSQILQEFKSWRVVVCSKTTSGCQTRMTISWIKREWNGSIILIQIRKFVISLLLWEWIPIDVSIYKFKFQALTYTTLFHREIRGLFPSSRCQGWLCFAIFVQWWSIWSDTWWGPQGQVAPWKQDSTWWLQTKPERQDHGQNQSYTATWCCELYQESDYDRLGWSQFHNWYKPR